MVIEGDLQYRTGKIAIVAARFNEYIVGSLLNGARDALGSLGVKPDDITVTRVPGAFELPLVAQQLAQSKHYDAIIALGAVIRGATPHFDYVCSECASGLSKVSLDHNLPVIFGVLTTDTIEQAIERAGTKAGNKGAEAAHCAVEMINLVKAIDKHA